MGLPNVGPGSLAAREAANVSGGGKMDSALLGPATDFYKKLALDCSGQQIAVDLFALGAHYLDLATLSGISKFSGGQVQHFPGYHMVENAPSAARFEMALSRYVGIDRCCIREKLRTKEKKILKGPCNGKAANFQLTSRYLTRKIGFEAVMRVRCTRGITPHTFHGNFFVRSTDLLSLPNINPDAGFAMQVSMNIEFILLLKMLLSFNYNPFSRPNEFAPL